MSLVTVAERRNNGLLGQKRLCVRCVLVHDEAPRHSLVARPAHHDGRESLIKEVK